MRVSYIALTMILPVSFIECGESLVVSLGDIYCRRPVWRSELTSTSWNRKDFSRLYHLSSCLFCGPVRNWHWRTRNYITLIIKAIILIPQLYFQVQRRLYSLLQKLFQIFKARSNMCTNTAFSGCPKSCPLFPWVTPTGECQSSEDQNSLQQGHSHQTYLTRSASRTAGSHSAVWWCSAPDKNLLWRSLHTDFLALVPNQISRSSKSEGQAPSQPSKTQRAPPCWQATGRTEDVIQSTQYKETLV